jgi:hypothetical protein
MGKQVENSENSQETKVPAGDEVSVGVSQNSETSDSNGNATDEENVANQAENTAGGETPEDKIKRLEQEKTDLAQKNATLIKALGTTQEINKDEETETLRKQRINRRKEIESLKFTDEDRYYEELDKFEEQERARTIKEEQSKSSSMAQKKEEINREINLLLKDIASDEHKELILDKGLALMNTGQYTYKEAIILAKSKIKKILKLDDATVVDKESKNEDDVVGSRSSQYRDINTKTEVITTKQQHKQFRAACKAKEI